MLDHRQRALNRGRKLLRVGDRPLAATLAIADLAGVGVPVLDAGVLHHARPDLAIASRYAELVPQRELREAIFARIRDEHALTLRNFLAITRQSALLEDNPTLARSIRNRFPYLDPLNHLQVELLRRFRAVDTDVRTQRAIHLTINGLAAGLRNSG